MPDLGFAPPTIKLDDGFYHDCKIAGKSAFRQLGARDPSPPEHVEAVYKRKVLEWRVDAAQRPGVALAVRDWSEHRASMERQLAMDAKFVDAGGLRYATIKDFQATTGSAAVFPAWIDSELQAGLIKRGYVPDLIFATEEVDSPNVTAVTLSDTEATRGLHKTSMGAELREQSAVLSSGSISLSKYGTKFHAPYEIVGLRRIDVIGQMLQRIGQQIAVDETDECLDVAIGGDGTTLGAAESNATDVDGTGAVAYSEMLNAMLLSGEPYLPNIAVADTAAMLRVGNLAEFKDPDVRAAVDRLDFPSPTKCRWIHFAAATNSHYLTGMIPFIDSTCALKKLVWGPTIQETDRIIGRQVEEWTFAYWAGFQKWDINGVVPYDWNAVL